MTGSASGGRAARRSLGEAARTVRVLATVAWRHSVDDPALLGLQISRRMPKRAARAVGVAAEQLGRSSRRLGGVRAFGLVVQGRHADAADAIRSAPAASRLAGEMAVAMQLAPAPDAPGAADLESVRANPATLARQLWQEGDLDGAIATLRRALRPGVRGARARAARSSLARLESERELLDPAFDLVTDELRGLARGLGVAADQNGAPGVPQGDGSSGAATVLHILTNSLPHTQSGYTLRSHAILLAQRGAGMRVRAMTRVGYPLLIGAWRARPVDTVDGIDYIRVLPTRLGRTMIERLRQQVEAALIEIAMGERPTHLHTTTNYTNALVTRAVSDLTGIPWVFEVRGLMEQTWAAAKPTAQARAAALDSQRARLIAGLEGALARQADAVVTLSATMRDELVDRGVPAESITLVPNSIDAALLERTETPVEARRALGLPADGFWVGAVSSLVDYEGFDLLVDAVAEARERGADVRLLLGGDGVSRPALLQQVRDLALEDAAVLPGRLTRGESARWVQALDAVVVPRRDTAVTRSVTPLKPVEAMALSRPVIASDLPALRELLADGNCGMLVPPEDPSALASAITGLAQAPTTHRSDAATTQAVGAGGRTSAQLARGRDQAEQRTWARAAGLYGEVYAGVYSSDVMNAEGADHR